MLPDAHPTPGTTRIEADALADGFGLDVQGGVGILLEHDNSGGLTIRAVGPVAQTRRVGRADRVIDRAGCVLIPGLVNAHTHLDLTHLGPRPFDPAGGFSGWIDMVRNGRENDVKRIAQSVRTGVDLARRGGTVLVGDIAGAVAGRASSAATIALRDACAQTGLHAVSYVEFFAQGTRWPDALAHTWQVIGQLQHACAGTAPLGRVIVGAQPHAPYSVALAAYAGILAHARTGPAPMPICTHLAESLDESELITHARGNLRHLLQSVGLWDELTSISFGHGRSPVQHLHAAGLLCPQLGLVHLNAMSAQDAELVRQSSAPIAYCPRASAYFHAPQTLGQHRYGQLLPTLALGTDSAINIPPDDLAERGLSVLDEARLLCRRDNLDPAQALAAATSGGERFLLGQARRSQLRLAPGATLLGLAAVACAGRKTTNKQIENEQNHNQQADKNNNIYSAAALVMSSTSPAEILLTGRLEF